MNALLDRLRSPLGLGVGVLLGVALLLAAEWLLPVPPAEGSATETLRLSEALDRLSVAAVTKGRRYTLERRGLGFGHRALPSWNWVGPLAIDTRVPEGEGEWPWQRLEGRDKAQDHGLWVHPVNDGHLVLRWEDVPGGGHLAGYYHYLRSARKGAKVELTFRHNGAEVSRIKAACPSGESREFLVALPPGPPGPLELEVKQQDRGKNHLVIDGLLLSGEAP